MSSDRIKVVGYTQKTTYNNDIEYRNFSPDLAGLQLTSEGGTPLFTLGNFSVTTNYEPKINKTFTTSKFSNFVSLNDLNLENENATNVLINNSGVYLNLDKRNLSNYALFGSLKEFIRVSLENIITYWPASLYINPLYETLPDYNTFSAQTVSDYSYNSLTNKSSFKIDTNTIQNVFKVNYLKNGDLGKNYNINNSLRNLTINYASYSVLYNNVEYPVLGFTGATNESNDYIYLVVEGNAFSGITNDAFLIYHIKPNVTQENLFFNSLDTLESYLLNRAVIPKYTSIFDFTVRTNSGAITYVTKSFTWPVSDGYNIDFDTKDYENYATSLLEISTEFDSYKGNLVTRFFVSESITGFDTAPVHLDPLDEDTSGQKVNKTLTIYGVEYDKINNFIQGISFANTVSYDKNNNTPDIYLKNIARVLGWDLVSSVLENNLLKSYIEPKQSTYSGQSVGLTAVEADIELWRRIILNTPWLWKSKGTRKAVEFLFKFIGTPLGLITFNEYVYLAENKIDTELFTKVLQLNNLTPDLSLYPISVSGYPAPFPNTSTLYFQNKGLWFRETGGINSDIDILQGNNPHVGPYDGGSTYINQFKNLIPDFSAVTISSETITTTSTNLFSNYNLGKFTAYSGQTYVDMTNKDNVDLSDCFVVNSSIIDDPKYRKNKTDCGCETPEDLNSLSICINKTLVKTNNCNKNIESFFTDEIYGYYTFNFYQYNIDGFIYKYNNAPSLYRSLFINKECCNFNSSIPYYYNQVEAGTNGNVLINSGYICCSQNNNCGYYVTCKWVVATERYSTLPNETAPDAPKYLIFIDELGNKRMVSQDGVNCLNLYSMPTKITDPYTKEVGYACKLNTVQNQVNNNDVENIIVPFYYSKSIGVMSCDYNLRP